MRPDFNPFDSSMRQSKYGGPRRGIFADPSHKSAFAKLHDADPGRGMRKVLMCVMLPPLFFLMWVVASIIPEVVVELQAGGGLHNLFTLATCAPFLSCDNNQNDARPLDGSGLVMDQAAAEKEERIQRQKVEAMAKDFVGEIDYRMLIETIWQQFPEMNIPLRTERALLDPAHQLDPSLPIRSNITELDPTAVNGAAWKEMGLNAKKELLDPEVFLRMKLADSQMKMCVATLWALVEKRRIDRVGAVEAEPICKQIAEMMKVVDLSNVIHGGTSALTPEQIAMLNGMLGRTMQDVFRSAYQTSVLFSPPSPGVVRAEAAGDAAQPPLNATDGSRVAGEEDRDTPDDGVRADAEATGRQEGYGYVGDTSEQLAGLAAELVKQRQQVMASGDYAVINESSYGIIGAGATDLMQGLETATCVKTHQAKLGQLLRLRWCQMESTVNNAVGATLMESLSAAILRVQIDHEKDKNADGAPEQAGMTSMQRLLYQLHQVNCRLVLVGTSDTRFPMFLEKVLNATNMAHCQVDIYEPNPRLNFLLESRLTAQGLYGDKLLHTKLKLIEVGPKRGNYTVKLPDAHDGTFSASHEDAPTLMNANRGKKATPVFVPKQQYHEATVERQKLDAVLCPPLAVRGINGVANYIPSCEVGEVPLVSIAAHADPTAVLASFPKMLRLGYVGAVLWEATWTSDIKPQVRIFHRTNYTVFAAILAPPNMVSGYNEPQLVRLDTDAAAVMTVEGLMRHHQLNVTLVALRKTLPYLKHATADVLQCENPCVDNSRTLGRPFGEGFLSQGSARSCVVPDMCMCSRLEPTPVLASPLHPSKKGKKVLSPRKAMIEAGTQQACVELDASWDRLMSQMFPDDPAVGAPPPPGVSQYFSQLGFIRGTDNLKSNRRHDEAMRRQRHQRKAAAAYSSKSLDERFKGLREGQLIGHPHRG